MELFRLEYLSLHKTKSRRALSEKASATAIPNGVFSMEKFSGISRAQLLKELREELEVLTACVANCVASVRAHFAGELAAVVAFIEYLTATPTNGAQTGKESQTRTSQPRCAHYKAIRRAFAIAREKGLNTREDEAMRAAIGRALGCLVESREVLSGFQWAQVGDLVKRGVIAW